MRKDEYMITKLPTDDLSRLLSLKDGWTERGEYARSTQRFCFVARLDGEAAGYVLAYAVGRRGFCTDLIVFEPHNAQRVSRLLVRSLFEATMSRVDHWSLPKTTYEAELPDEALFYTKSRRRRAAPVTTPPQ